MECNHFSFMIKKLQVLVREVYESEETEEIIAHKKTGEKISSWEFKQLSLEEKENYSFNDVGTSKSKIVVSEGDPVYGQVFSEQDLNVKELILHLNRTK